LVGLSAQCGLAGYLNFEEALGTTLEDALQSVFNNFGVNYQIIAGLAYGLDNHGPRDLREVFEVSGE